MPGEEWAGHTPCGIKAMLYFNYSEDCELPDYLHGSSRERMNNFVQVEVAQPGWAQGWSRAGS